MEEVLRIVVPGVHTEKLGAANQPWDEKVRGCVQAELVRRLPRKSYEWYEIEAGWFALPTQYPRDLDNFRIKRVLDALTAEGFWPDDSVRWVRRIESRVEFVGHASEERLEASVYGVEE